MKFSFCFDQRNKDQRGLLTTLEPQQDNIHSNLDQILDLCLRSFQAKKKNTEWNRTKQFDRLQYISLVLWKIIHDAETEACAISNLIHKLQSAIISLLLPDYRHNDYDDDSYNNNMDAGC